MSYRMIGGLGSGRPVYAEALRADPAQWRQRAAQSRRTADQLDDPADRKTMLEIAHAYEKLATLAEAKRGSKPAREYRNSVRLPWAAELLLSFQLLSC